MNTIISANFENVDFASMALSKIRNENKDLKYLRIKNRNGFDKYKPHTLAALSYYSQSPFDGVEYQPTSMIPNGALPIAFYEKNNINSKFKDKNKSVTVEISTSSLNYNKICNQLRSNGGYDVKINSLS